MNANAPVKSVFKGNLVFNTFIFPVSVYKSDEVFGIEGHLFHENCGSPVISPRKCIDHPDLENPPTFSALERPDGKFRKISPETRKFLLHKDLDTMEIVSSHLLRDLPELINSNRFIPAGFFEIVPQKLNKRISLSHAQLWQTFLNRLNIKKRFLIITYPMDGMYRYGALFGSGQMFTLLYEEEIREQYGNEGGAIEPKLNKSIDSMFTELDAPFPVLSCQSIIDEINNWLEADVDETKPIVARQNNVVSLETMMKSLKDAVQQ